ncbi:MAG: hypothetical protein KBT06_04370 [Prevotellaceae bacterium]|nr:hypothetical protein [Candidatus Colivivens equi]
MGKLKVYLVRAERDRNVEVFSIRRFSSIAQINDYFRGFEMWDVTVCINIYKDGAYIGYMQDTPDGLVAVSPTERILKD